MRKLFKRLSVLFAATLAFNSVLSLSSLASDTTSVKDKQLEYAEKAVATYLQSYDVAHDDIYISESFDVYDMSSGLDTNDLYVVFNEDDVIGILSVADVNGSYYSSFEYSKFDTLQEIYNNEETFNFVCNDEKLYINNSAKTYSIDDVSEVVACDFELAANEHIERTYRIDFLDSSPTYVYRKNLYVPIVQNESIGNGICWAAAIASKHDYLNNTTLVAHDVYYTMQNVYGGTPVGNPLWIERAFQYYGISCTTIYRMMDCVEIYNNIENNNPIYMSVANSTAGHALMLSGLTINSDNTGIYRVVDSNRMSYVDIMVPANTMVSNSGTSGNFTYATSYGYTFTHWRRSHY